MIRWVYAVIERPAEQLDAAVAFWSAVTGTHRLHRDDADDWLEVREGDGGARLRFASDDVPALVAAAIGLGATTGDEPHVLRSPAGLAFEVTQWEGETRLLPAGARSQLDQVCLDVALTAYPSEIDFWGELTGWQLQSFPPQFRRLVRPQGIPVQILLQSTDDGSTKAHLDIASADAEGDRRRHEALGATLVQDFPEWIVMRDPAAGIYCLTRRNPRD
ncbi:VOC family protein [Winogradskya humida]|uniref:Glyoxalase-like domain-containing protein n=1 Tax=Winogradskya humida TaxID=113566 RepID=A0ABQ3ZIM7_9ACTN|nr:VOC family protein [Actinoplanes humidus]GIE18374.1 hypothetical protein Ahu01nite_014760 [Actinoplanes humidus]